MKRLMENLDDLAGQDMVLSRDGRQGRDFGSGDLRDSVARRFSIVGMASWVGGTMFRRKSETHVRPSPCGS